MAKKKQELSPEERLAAALVPEEEQPYQLPEGWKWVYLGKIMEWTSGGTPSRKHVEYYNGDIPWVKTGELNDGYINDTSEKITEEAIKCSSAKVMPVHTVLLAMYGATIGRVAILNIKAATNQACACGICSEWIYFKFLFYFLKSQKNHFINLSKGGAQPNISQKIIKKSKMPLAEYAEQKRVVSCIESLFAKLDAAKAKVQSVLDAHEARKAALLHDAFAGKLTTEWRANRNISYDDWRLVSIQDICHSLKYGTAKKSESSGRYVVIRMGNLFDGEIIWENLAYSDDEDDIKKYQLSPGDVLFNRTNSAALVGKTSIYRGEYPAIYAGYIIKLDYDREIVVGEFLNYVMNSVQAKVYCNKVKTDGVNQSNINAKKIGAFQFRLPTFSEQQEIVRILNKLIGKEACIKQSAESVLESIDRMKQSILARAFRGKL